MNFNFNFKKIPKFQIIKYFKNKKLINWEIDSSVNFDIILIYYLTKTVSIFNLCENGLNITIPIINLRFLITLTHHNRPLTAHYLSNNPESNSFFLSLE
jgi:hypothetical protein